MLFWTYWSLTAPGHVGIMRAFFRCFPFVFIERKSGLEQHKGKEIVEI